MNKAKSFSFNKGFSFNKSWDEPNFLEKNEYWDGSTALQDQLEYLPFDDNFEVDPVNLKILEVLGGGHFGDVHLGLLKTNDSHTLVAVKTAKSALKSRRMSRMNDSQREQELCKQREALRDELKIMSFLPEHPNVVKLLGAITTVKNDFSVLTEYCEHRGLDSFLQQKFDAGNFINEILSNIDGDGYIVNAERIVKTMRQISQDPSRVDEYTARRNSGKISTSDLLSFALQIARAMAFLTANMVLHRDVALRNVLLKADYTIRVADFGLSRRAGNDGSYFQSRNIVVPYRYIAPEALRSGRFSKQSELWSFGVVLWELFTFAKWQPYDGVEYCSCGAKDVSGILDYLDSGQRLKISEYTPASVATMITGLWHEDPGQRPSFKACQDIIKEELMQFNPLIVMFHEFSVPRESITSVRKVAIKVDNGLEDVPVCKENKMLRRRLHCIIGLSLLLAVLCAVLIAVLCILQPNGQTNEISIAQDSKERPANFIEASNNETYEFMLEWNISTVKLKTVKEAVNGTIYHTNANNISLYWQLSFNKSSEDSHWLGFYLTYESGVLERVGIAKMNLEAVSKSSAVVFHRWSGESWIRKHQKIGAQKFMPLNFDDSKFGDGIVRLRIYWTTETAAQVKSQLDNEIFDLLDDSDSQLPCCPDGWTPMPNSHKCIQIGAERKSWVSANRTCFDQGGHLLSIHNATDARFVVSLARIFLQLDDRSVWIGGRTNRPKANDINTWFWTDGADFRTHMLWNKGEPNNKHQSCDTRDLESCLEFVLRNGKWNDNCCKLQLPYICELFVSKSGACN